MDNCYVYLHRRLDTNEVFYVGIGSSKNFKRAYNENQRSIWWKKIVKKADHAVDIIYKNISWEQACKYEINLIAMYGRKDLRLGKLVNMTNGGEGCTGYILTDAHKEIVRLSSTGRKHKPESIALMSKIQKGKIVSVEGRNNMSVAQKNRIRTSEELLRLSMYSNKLVINIATGIIYKSIKQAAESCNMNPCTLRNYLIGRRVNKTTFMLYKNQINGE